MTNIFTPNNPPPINMFKKCDENFFKPISFKPNKKVIIKLKINKRLGIILDKNSFKLICFLIYKFHEITILINIEIVFAKKNDPAPIFSCEIK